MDKNIFCKKKKKKLFKKNYEMQECKQAMFNIKILN